MRYQVVGVQRYLIAGVWREPGDKFEADVDPVTERFMLEIGALRRMPVAKPKRGEVTEE